MTKTATKTITVPERVSFFVGQVTFFNSVLTSLKNCLAPSNFDRMENVMTPPFSFNRLAASLISKKDKTWQARRDLNPHHPDLESGALSVRATGLRQSLRFLVNGVLSTKAAVFLKLELIRCRPLIFRHGIVSSFAFSTS